MLLSNEVVLLLILCTADLAPFEIQLGSDLQQEVRKINQRKLDAAAALVEDGTENPKRGNDNEQELQR